VRTPKPTAPELVTDGASPDAVAGVAAPVRFGAAPTDATEPDEQPPSAAATSTLPLVTLVLGIAGAALGVVVIWYLAAIVVGLAAVVVGLVALRKTRAVEDDRGQSRATIGAMLGAIALVLGISAAILLPHAMSRVDGFFATLRSEVNHNVTSVNRGLRADVNRLDRSNARDLRRAERQNKSDLDQLEQRTGKTLDDLAGHIAQVETRLTDAERRDLAGLEQSLRADIRNLDAAMHSSSDGLGERIAKLEQEMADLQKAIHP
jgi:hypothetical protein